MTLAVTHQDAADGTFSATGATNWNKTHAVAGLGTGVETALGVNVGTAGAPIVNGGALGTPASGILTNCTGLPLAGNGFIANIQGLGGRPVSTTAVRVFAGACAINGKWLSLAQTDYTSGSTMKDLANATVTAAANKSYYIFAYDNSGTLNIRFEIADGTGDGADPVFSATYDYWTASDTAQLARRIGKVWTDGSGNFIPATVIVEGRIRTYELYQFDAVALVTSGTQTTPTTVTLTPYYGADDSALFISVYIQCTTNPAVSHLYVDGGTLIFASSLHYVTAAGIMAKFEKFVLPNTQDLKYEINTGGTGALTTIYASGTRLYV